MLGPLWEAEGWAARDRGGKRWEEKLGALDQGKGSRAPPRLSCPAHREGFRVCAWLLTPHPPGASVRPWTFTPSTHQAPWSQHSGLTHQSRLHCSGQTPCTSLEITAKTGISFEKGGPCGSPPTPLRELARSLGSPHLTPHPRGGLSTSPIILAELVLPALLCDGCQGERRAGVTLTLSHAGQLFPSRSHQ